MGWTEERRRGRGAATGAAAARESGRRPSARGEHCRDGEAASTVGRDSRGCDVGGCGRGCGVEVKRRRSEVARRWQAANPNPAQRRFSSLESLPPTLTARLTFSHTSGQSTGVSDSRLPLHRFLLAGIRPQLSRQPLACMQPRPRAMNDARRLAPRLIGAATHRRARGEGEMGRASRLSRPLIVVARLDYSPRPLLCVVQCVWCVCVCAARTAWGMTGCCRSCIHSNCNILICCICRMRAMSHCEGMGIYQPIHPRHPLRRRHHHHQRQHPSSFSIISMPELK